MFTFCICTVNMHKIIAYVCKLFMQCAKISRYCKLWYVTASITNYTFQQKPNAMQIFDTFIFECVNQKTHVKLYFGLVWGYWKRFYVGWWCIWMNLYFDWTCFLCIDSERGGWGAWSVWTPCSTTCAGGTRNRYRVCDSPPPRYGAMFCEVNDIIYNDSSDYKN